MSSSSSQIDHATMSEDQLVEMLSKMKSSRETEALRARLPAQLAPFASNISIIEPIQTVCTSPSDGIHCCCCGVKERRICMSVVVVPSPHSKLQDSKLQDSESQDSKSQDSESQGSESQDSKSQDSESQDSEFSYSEEPHVKPLELVWRDWRTSSMYSTGCAQSNMHSISLRYGSHRRGMRSEATAFTGWYEDPATSESESSHGGVKSVVEEVVRDMGFRGGELDNQLEVIEALLGDDGRKLLESHAQDGTTLRKIIEDELEEENYPY